MTAELRERVARGQKLIHIERVGGKVEHGRLAGQSVEPPCASFDDLIPTSGASVPLLVQATEHEAFQFLGQLGAMRPRRILGQFEMRVPPVVFADCRVQAVPGEELVQDAAVGVDIGSNVGWLISPLLGRHIGRRSPL